MGSNLCINLCLQQPSHEYKYFFGILLGVSACRHVFAILLNKAKNPEFSLSNLSSNLKAIFFCNFCLISFLSCVLIFFYIRCWRRRLWGLVVLCIIYVIALRANGGFEFMKLFQLSTVLNPLSEILLSLRAFETNLETVFFLVIASV